jgi:Flp pilus assembly protein TadD
MNSATIATQWRQLSAHQHTVRVTSIALLSGLAVVLPLRATALPLVPTSIAQAQTSQPNNPRLNELLRQGRQLVDAGNVAGAIAAYEEAATLQPSNARIFSGIGFLQARQGNHAAAC